MKGLKTIASKGINELELFLVNVDETGIQIDDRTENSYGNTGNNNGFGTCSKPYDK